MLRLEWAYGWPSPAVRSAAADLSSMMAIARPTPRWFTLPDHVEHERLESSTWPFGPVRFALIAAGRRSYKSERMKRRAIRNCLTEARHEDHWAVLAAPTHDQAKGIFWEDCKRLAPARLVRKVSEVDRSLRFVTGAELSVVGLDKPARIEGRPLDFFGCTEFADVKVDAWESHVRPMLDNVGENEPRLGCAWLEGVPDGKRNDLFRLRNKFLEFIAAGDPTYGVFWWKTADVQAPEVVEAARKSMDPRLFRQEYEASFEDYAGLAYYPFSRAVHASEPLSRFYRKDRELFLCFDFNVSPGVAVVAQEINYDGKRDGIEDAPLAALGEVWIEKHSNTPMVCRKLAADWGRHEGPVLVYGDATGGAQGSAKVGGSDWDLIFAGDSPLRRAFGGRMRSCVPKRNPSERARVTAVNHLLQTAEEPPVVSLLVCPARCPKLVEDFEAVSILEGTDGEIDKKTDKRITHLTDAFGYCIEARYPVIDRTAATIVPAADIWAPP